MNNQKFVKVFSGNGKKLGNLTFKVNKFTPLLRLLTNIDNHNYLVRVRTLMEFEYLGRGV